MPPTYFARLRTAAKNGIQRPLIGQEGRYQDSLEVLIEQGKFGLCSNRLFHSSQLVAHTDSKLLLRPGTVFAATDLLLFNQRKNLAVVGALSRPFSVPSVSGPTFQVCGYHVDRALSESCQLSVSSKFQGKPMAGCGSKALLGEVCLDSFYSRCANPSLFKSNAGTVSRNTLSLYRCRKTSMSLKSQEQPGNYSVYGYLMYNAAKRWVNVWPYTESGLRYFHISSSTCFSAGTAPDVSFDNSAREEQVASSIESSEQYVLRCSLCCPVTY